LNQGLLSGKTEELAQQWYERVLATYPDQTAKFLRSQPDPFSNPVGSSTFGALTELVDGLVGDGDIPSLRPAVDRVVRIRALQDFSPSQAVGFVFELKQVLRSFLSLLTLDEKERREAMDHLEVRIDALALLAFDVHSECREQIYRLRIDEVKGVSRDYLEHLRAERKAGGGEPDDTTKNS
jgi:hypothetical protein